MVGLEKVTNKIIASAEADAARILAEADAECAAIIAAVTLNRSDRVSFGKALIAQLSSEKNGIEWKLSDSEARIGGGLLLDSGDTRTDCSVAALISEVRPALEGDVCRILFGGEKEKNNG